MILLLHTIIEGAVGLLLLAYSGAAELLPGFSEGSGQSYTMSLKMYGLAACFLAAMSLLAYLKKTNEELVRFITLSLTGFHLGMTIIQAIYNADQRVMLLHFLLMIFLAGYYIREKNWKKAQWRDKRKNNVLALSYD